jgi:glycosyltransferase involved in cell wall biosynthesis
MHILLIHQAFAGPRDPGGTRHFELASLLAERGHRTTIIASQVNYLTGESVAAGDDELPDGVRVVRVAGSQSFHRSYAARFGSFLGFGGGALRAAASQRDVDVVWGTSPPLPQLLPAWLASLRCAGGFVLEERDLWPEFAIGMGVVKPGAVTSAALRFKRLMYGRARRVIVNSPGFLPFLQAYRVDPAKVRVIANGVDPRAFDPMQRAADLRAEWGIGERFAVLYAGAHGPANDLDVVLRAAARLRGSRAVFVLVGDGKAKPELMQAAEAAQLDNVIFVPAQPKDRMPQVLAAADACLATLRDIPLFRTTYPNKVFDGMAAGRPIVLAIDGVIRDVVEQARAGVFVPPGDPEALAVVVDQLMAAPEEARSMGLRGRRCVCERFDRRLHADQLETLFAEVLAEGRSKRSFLTPPRRPLGQGAVG